MCSCPMAVDPVSAVPVTTDWQSAFEELLPAIQSQACFAFRSLPSDIKTEAVQEAICTACAAFARLHQRGRAEVATATTLARFAVKRYRVGRRVAEQTNRFDVTSPACQWRSCVVREPHVADPAAERPWEAVLDDKRFTPADVVAAKLDFAAFLETLDSRRRQIAGTLAAGETTQDTARLYGLSPGRISQFRRELKAGWDHFVGNVIEAPAAA